MNTPKGIGPNVWGLAEGALDTMLANHGYDGWRRDSIETIARAILKAKNDAYEEAAREAEGYDGLGTYPSEGSAYGDSSLTQMDISQAIRNLKHETEV